MKRSTILLSLLSFCSLSLLSHSQVVNCGGSLNIDNGACQTATCSDIFPITSLNDCNTLSCNMYIKTSTLCCGLRIRYFTGGGSCLVTQLKDPEFRVKVRFLAEKEDILIPTCGGEFVPASALNEQLGAAQQPNDAKQRS